MADQCHSNIYTLILYSFAVHLSHDRQQNEYDDDHQLTTRGHMCLPDTMVRCHVDTADWSIVMERSLTVLDFLSMLLTLCCVHTVPSVQHMGSRSGEK